MDVFNQTPGDAMLAREVAQLRMELVNHSIYQRLVTADDLKIYMKHHVFAVWDFMTLLKRLQQDLTSVQMPWVPKPRPEFTRFINEIVLDEESDEDGQGGYASHFALYLAAMHEMDADDRPMERFLALLAQPMPAEQALATIELTSDTAQFVLQTLDVAQNGRTHEVAAAFFYGREDVIPDMFRQMVEESADVTRTTRFVYYLRRHIELDGDQHGPLAERLLRSLCEEDGQRWDQALGAARRALKARIRLWNGILEEMDGRR
ncbi:MAG: DUF3050 domain-containing protein [Firmicutes bacterium]|nr:DUF3050 domain-containing protein [Bacillota bacterium]